MSFTCLCTIGIKTSSYSDMTLGNEFHSSKHTVNIITINYIESLTFPKCWLLSLKPSKQNTFKWSVLIKRTHI